MSVNEEADAAGLAELPPQDLLGIMGENAAAVLWGAS